MNPDQRNTPGARVAATTIIAIAWFILVNALFFWGRISESALVRRLLERIGP